MGNLFLSVLLFVSSTIAASAGSPVHAASDVGYIRTGYVPTGSAASLTRTGALALDVSGVRPMRDTLIDPVGNSARNEEGLARANRKAKNSVTMGIVALSALVAALVFPPLALATIPLGVLAIVKGQEARKEGATRANGTVLGIVSLSLMLVVVIFVAAVIAAWATPWW